MGWGRNISFNHDFIGRAALEEEVANPRRKIVSECIRHNGISLSYIPDFCIVAKFELVDHCRRVT